LKEKLIVVACWLVAVIVATAFAASMDLKPSAKSAIPKSAPSMHALDMRVEIEDLVPTLSGLVPAPTVQVLENVKAPKDFTYRVTRENGVVDGVVTNGDAFRDFLLLRVCVYDQDRVLVRSHLAPFYGVGPKVKLRFQFRLEPGSAGTRAEVCTAFAQ
jgi:hypothetical protein